MSQKLGKQEKWCENPLCSSINGKKGKWRTDRGSKGGGKNWCNECLKNEENPNHQKIMKDKNRHYFFCCSLCS